MGDVPALRTGGAIGEALGAGGIATSASANTKGAYTQIIAATARDYHALLLVASSTGAVVSTITLLVDIAIGAAGSEQVIVPNISLTAVSSIKISVGPLLIPIFIPAGSRVAVRAQASTGSRNVDIDVIGLAGYEQRGSGFGLATDYGSDTANSTGTTVTSGAAGTKGSYAQLTASCNEVSYLIVMVNKGSATATDYQLVDIAIGGAGSEQIILPNLRSSQTSSAGHLVPCLYGYPVKIPAGTRIAARIAFGQASKTAQISCIGVA